MGRRFVIAGLAVAISLSLLGAALTAGEIAAPTQADPPKSADPQQGADPQEANEPKSDPEAGSSEAPPARASTQVPIRSASLDLQTDEVGDSAPTRVRVAAIGLDASVVPVGVDEEQQFDVPSAEKVGWYKFGSDPNDSGSTVLAAHVDFAGRPGAFFNLASVRPGDELEIELADQTIRSYRVINNVLYDKTDLPAEDLFRRSGEPNLQLITCGGTFDFETRSYRGNVVVTAVPVAT